LLCIEFIKKIAQTTQKVATEVVEDVKKKKFIAN